MILKKTVLVLFLFLLYKNNHAQEIKKLTLSQGEKVWSGLINDGYKMPLKEDYSFDFFGRNDENQSQPLLLTSKGQFVWSEQPFAFKIHNNELEISDPYNMVQTGKSGNTLAEVQKYVLQKFFRASGKMPDSLLFSRPQYNTWIELTYHENQADVLKYAQGIIDNGFTPGVITIDAGWQEDYGVWKFHLGRFPKPKEMIDQLHREGFKVMLWICPFVIADQYFIYSELKKSKSLLLEKKRETDTWDSKKKPLMVEWWEGQSAVLDFSNSEAVNWFNAQLERLTKDYSVDGFKFDAGDMPFYPSNSISKGNITPNQHCELYAKFGLKYPLNEYRACWKMGGQPLGQRLTHKKHTWTDLQKLIPNMIVEGLSGYPFSCPDMIGGGEWTSFLDPSKIDQDLIVRSAQCHALMPMMQFSVAPWRILDRVHLEAVKKAVALREIFTPLILKLAHEAANTGDPILKSMEFVFSNQGMEEASDQFMLGDKVLVASVLTKENTRSVKLPLGNWLTPNGMVYKGGQTINVQAPIDQLLYFRLIN